MINIMMNTMIDIMNKIVTILMNLYIMNNIMIIK
jgi:hypothetical protein